MVSHSEDWSEVRLQVAAAPDGAAAEIAVVVRPDGFVIPQQRDILLGEEAIRIIATAIRAAQRAADG